MASRNFTQFSGSLEKFFVSIFATIDFNDASSPALKSWSVPGTGGAGSYATASASGYKGVLSVVRTAQGKYTITLQDRYVRFLGMDWTYKAIDGITSPKALNIFTMTEAVATSTPTIVLGATNTANSTTLVDLGANDRLLFCFYLSNSSAQ